MLAQSSGLKLRHKFNTIAFACLSAVSSSTVTCHTENILIERPSWCIFVCVRKTGCLCILSISLNRTFYLLSIVWASLNPMTYNENKA